ncbi:MAG: shikimate kinase [Leptolyngbya sp.]|nr:shikimate kinase [Leptolyngbya sp.]
MILTERLQGTNLYLIGMMGAGKSSTGTALAQALGYQFFDTDAVLEAAAGRTISEIFAEEGEEGFRQQETEVLAQLSAYRRLVIATGGGLVTQRRNWGYLHHGIVVWLDVPLALLEQRLAGETGRPLLQRPDWRSTLADLVDQRQSLYAQADVRVPVGAEDGVEAITTQILSLVDERLRTDAPANQLN